MRLKFVVDVEIDDVDDEENAEGARFEALRFLSWLLSADVDASYDGPKARVLGLEDPEYPIELRVDFEKECQV